ncbi:MetQ/NlpA family ABC transporter substrate-binding protein [Bacillaceae bacterium S4-13-56]
MKKVWLTVISALFILALAACGTSDENSADTENNAAANQASEENNTATNEGTEQEEQDLVTLKVGATSVPHAEVLEQAQPLLEEQGVQLEIEVYQDYLLPNEDLSNGGLDANYFQHIPYLEQQIADFGYDFVNAGGIHIEPMGIYSKNIKSVDDIKEGTVVIMSRSIADHGRILSLLEREGILKLSDDVNKVEATEDDIVENPLNLEFDASIDAGFLPEYYEREEDALVAINTNYAIEAGLIPTEDALILEGSESPYVNVIAVRSEDKESEAIQKLVDVLRSEEIQNFINEKYEGAVVPVSE